MVRSLWSSSAVNNVDRASQQRVHVQSYQRYGTKPPLWFNSLKILENGVDGRDWETLALYLHLYISNDLSSANSEDVKMKIKSKYKSMTWVLFLAAFLAVPFFGIAEDSKTKPEQKPKPKVTEAKVERAEKPKFIGMPTYVPPNRGRPKGRVGGGSRGGPS